MKNINFIARQHKMSKQAAKRKESAQACPFAVAFFQERDEHKHSMRHHRVCPCGFDYSFVGEGQNRPDWNEHVDICPTARAQNFTTCVPYCNNRTLTEQPDTCDCIDERKDACANAIQKHKEYNLFRSFGEDYASYLRHFDRQEYKCGHFSMCGKMVRPYTLDACLDHDHVDGYEEMSAQEKRIYNDGILCA